MNEDIDRIVILEKNLFGNLSKCRTCNINFTAIQPCIVCQLVIEREENLRRKITREEFRELMKELLG